MSLIVKGTPKSNAYIDKDGVAKSQIVVNIQEINMLTFPKEKNELTSITPINEESSLASTPKITEVIELSDDDIPF